MKTALILIVGNKYNRVVKAINYVDPDLIYFMHTEGYRFYLDKILKESDIVKKEKRYMVVEDFQSINESYNKSSTIFKELSNGNYDIYVAISNGTKAMLSGLVLASSTYDCKLLYVGSDKNGRGPQGEVLPGHEEIRSEFNPMKEQANLELEKGKQFFNSYQFDYALENFKLAKKYSNKKIMDIYINIARLYQSWDKFEDKIAYNDNGREIKPRLGRFLEKRILDEINNDEEIKNYFRTNEKTFYSQLKCNKRFLDKKIHHRKCIVDENNIFYFLVDLVNNAHRRIEMGRYDDATARLYRSMELIAQIRLLKKFELIDARKLEYDRVFHIRKDKLNEFLENEKDPFKENLDYNIHSNKISEDDEKVYENNKIYSINEEDIDFITIKDDYKNPEKTTVKLNLEEDYELLNALNDKFASEFFENKTINNNLSARNNSILAHGLKTTKKESTEAFYFHLMKYAKETSIISEYEFEKDFEQSSFPKFKDINL